MERSEQAVVGASCVLILLIVSAAAAQVDVPAVLRQSNLPRSLAGRMTPAEIAQTIFDPTPAEAPAKPARPRKVLVFTMCSGYYHEAIPVVAAAFEIMGHKTGAYTTVVSDDPAMFEPDRLKQFDAIVPRVVALEPTVLIVTGDHSTPAKLRSHSWHPVPTLLVAEDSRGDPCEVFGETEALKGELGHFPAVELMPLALAHAGRLGKYGA